MAEALVAAAGAGDRAQVAAVLAAAGRAIVDRPAVRAAVRGETK